MKPRQALSPSSRQGVEAMDGPRSCCKGTINSPMNQLFAHLFCLCHGFVAQFLHTLCKVRLSAQSAQGRRLALAGSGANQNGSLKTDNPNNPYKDEAPGESLVGETRFLDAVRICTRCLGRIRCLARMLCRDRMIASPRPLFCHCMLPWRSGVLDAPLRPLSSYALIFG